MDGEDLRDCTLPDPGPGWLAHVSGVPGQGMSFALDAARAGVRHLRWPGGHALVTGQPRPEQAPGAGAADPDPAMALVRAWRTGGVSALRHVDGPWSLLCWDAQAGELLLAVDRLGRESIALAALGHGWQAADSVETLAAHFGLPQTPVHPLVVLDRLAGGTLVAQGVPPPADAVGWLPPGTHVRLREDGSWQAGHHGSWRLEKRERRPAVLVAGEFSERLKSVLRLYLEQADLVLLAEDAVEGALVAAALAQLAGPQPAVLYLPALACGDRAHWSEVCAYFHLRLLEPDLSSLPTASLRVLPRPPWLPGRGGRDAAVGSPGGELAIPALQQLAAVAATLGDCRTPADRPLWLLSAQGLDLALPEQSLPLLSIDAWRSLRDEPPPDVAGTGARLADACARRWQPALCAALRGSGLTAAWPMLDETVSHFLANLPVSMLLGNPWSFDFRRRILRDLLPPHLRAAAPGTAAPGAAHAAPPTPAAPPPEPGAPAAPRDLP